MSGVVFLAAPPALRASVFHSLLVSREGVTHRFPSILSEPAKSCFESAPDKPSVAAARKSAEARQKFAVCSTLSTELPFAKINVNSAPVDSRRVFSSRIADASNVAFVHGQ